MITYLLLSNVSLILFYLLYKLLLQRDTFFQWRRLYFLFVILFSMLLPLAERHSISVAETSVSPQISDKVEFWMQSANVYLEEVVVSAQLPLSISWWKVLYAIVVSAFLIVFLLRLWSLHSLKANCQRSYVGDDCVWIHQQENIAPFSFFGTIVCAHSLLQSPHLVMVLQHEKVHVRQWHSIDVCIAELMTMVFFFNPVVYLLKREMRLNLEYIADKACSKRAEQPKAYQYAILQMATAQQKLAISNYFNYSPIKNRIIMLNTTRSKQVAMLKYLSVIPLVLALLMLSESSKAQKVNSTQQQSIEKAKEASVQVENEPAYQGEKVYQVVEQMPEYPGGAAELFKFIMENVRYPKAAKEAKVEGRVFLSFVVSKTGEIVNVKLLRANGTAPVKRMQDGVTTEELLQWTEDEKVYLDLPGGDLKDVITDTKAVMAAVPLLKAEAIRVVKSMPAWQPGKANGKAVNVQYSLPLRFSLSK